MGRLKIPTIVAFFVLVFGVAAGVFLVQRTQILKVGASPELAPQDVRITNVSGDSFTVSWTTDRSAVGFIKWGTTESSLNETQLPEEGEENSNLHYVIVRNLLPNADYFFKINSGGEEFDNSGIPWQTRTGALLEAPTGTRTISGTILTATGDPAQNVLVYATAGNVSSLSTKTSASGTWVIPISQARVDNLQNYVQVTDRSPLLEIFVQAGPLGISSAQIYPIGAAATPPMILGQTHDFRQETGSGTSDLPEATIGLPEDSTPSSKFSVPEGEVATASANAVVLESIDEGEVVSTTQPEFFGEGPPGTTLTIVIESTDEITDTVTVPASGNWSFNPPTGLSEGTHKITISWRDTSGILRTLTRTFIVQAAEGPAFESTPSATPKATATPKPTATPKASPTATASATPSATPRVSIPSTESAIPQSGTLTPTIALSIMGIGLLAAAFYIWKYA